jgi:GntR family transcriptional repressor for pyruvate dehydrogenase complex
LPTEKELAETIRVSRPTLREALTVLEAMGYIEIRPREGSFVRSMVPAPLREPVAAMLERHPERIFELFEVRRQIDPEGAALAAERATERDIAQLREYLGQAKALVAGGRSIFSPEVADLYAKTFFRIAEATQNSAYTYVMRMLWTMVEGAFVYSREKLSLAPSIFGKLFKQYVVIVEAIAARDPHRARRAVAQHLDLGERALHRILTEESTATEKRDGAKRGKVGINWGEAKRGRASAAP